MRWITLSTVSFAYGQIAKRQLQSVEVVPPPHINQQQVYEQQAPPYQQQAIPVQQQAIPVQQQAIPVQQQAIPVQQQGMPAPVYQIPPQQANLHHQQAMPVHQQQVPIPQQQQVPIPQQQQVPMPQQQQQQPHHQPAPVFQYAPPPVYHHPPPPQPPSAHQDAHRQTVSNQQGNPPVQNVKQRESPIAPQDLSDEEFRQLVANAPSSFNANVTSDNLAQQWEEIMQDFMPDTIVTFRLQGGEGEYFHLDVEEPGVLIRGGFFESNDGKHGACSFTAISPDSQVMYSSRNSEGLFRFEAPVAGTYTFGTIAVPWTAPVYVTFVLGTGAANRLTSDEVTTLEGRIKAMYRQMGGVEHQATYLWIKQQSMLHSMNKTAGQTYYALVVELLCTAVATALSVLYIKRTVAKRRIF